MSKAIFEFKNDVYTFKELFSFYLSNKSIFKSGDVTNLETGEMFDISEICEVKIKYYNLLNEVTNIVGSVNDNRFRWAIQQEEKERIYLSLKEKYENNKISLEEMYEYIILKKEMDKEFTKNRSLFSIKYDNFIMLNIGEKLPKEIKYIDKGRFYDMLYYLSFNNKLKHSPRKNGRIIKKEDLMKELDFKDYSVYRKFISSLAKHNVIKEIPTSNKTKVIILNPVYVNRNIRIDYTTYIIFKDDLQKFLTQEEIYYIEMLGNKDELIDVYEIE